MGQGHEEALGFLYAGPQHVGLWPPGPAYVHSVLAVIRGTPVPGKLALVQSHGPKAHGVGTGTSGEKQIGHA